MLYLILLNEVCSLSAIHFLNHLSSTGWLVCIPALHRARITNSLNVDFCGLLEEPVGVINGT